MLSHSVISDSVTPRTVAHQAPLSMGFSRQEHWSGCPCPPPGDLPDPGIEPASPGSPAWAGRFFTTSAPWEAQERTYGMVNARFRAVKGKRGVTGEGDTVPRLLAAFHFWSHIVQGAHCDVFKTPSVCTEFIIVILEKIPTFTHNYRNANVTEGLVSQKKKRLMWKRFSFEAFLFLDEENQHTATSQSFWHTES